MSKPSREPINPMGNSISFIEEKDLKPFGIEYPAGSSPIAMHPQGWDWDEPKYVKYELAPGSSPQAWIDANKDMVSRDAKLNFGDSKFRIACVRSQFFLRLALDPNPLYLIVQPYTTK